MQPVTPTQAEEQSIRKHARRRVTGLLLSIIILTIFCCTLLVAVPGIAFVSSRNYTGSETIAWLSFSVCFLVGCGATLVGFAALGDVIEQMKYENFKIKNRVDKPTTLG